MHNLYSVECIATKLLSTTQEMACHFIDNDIISGNNDVMTDSSKSASIKIFTDMKVFHSDIKSGTILFS